MKLTDVIRRPSSTERRRSREDGRTIGSRWARREQKYRSTRAVEQAARRKSPRHSDQHRARQDQAQGRYAGADRTGRRLREAREGAKMPEFFLKGPDHAVSQVERRRHAPASRLSRR